MNRYHGLKSSNLMTYLLFAKQFTTTQARHHQALRRETMVIHCGNIASY
ncbi:hypothetical protein D049_3214 [Vibrio parahaemolyticus VPTS-2010]|nr:hypothetical protein D049_3214 [Vibrio parahaemolyticus VPTS-2010]